MYVYGSRNTDSIYQTLILIRVIDGAVHKNNEQSTTIQIRHRSVSRNCHQISSLPSLFRVTQEQFPDFSATDFPDM